MQQIADKCYDAIDSCNVVLVVGPFGSSVSAEIGYAIYKKRKFSNTIIILFRYRNENKEKQDKEAMLVPFYDFLIDSTNKNCIEDALNELISLLNSLKKV